VIYGIRSVDSLIAFEALLNPSCLHVPVVHECCKRLVSPRSRSTTRPAASTASMSRRRRLPRQAPQHPRPSNSTVPGHPNPGPQSDLLGWFVGSILPAFPGVLKRVRSTLGTPTRRPCIYHRSDVGGSDMRRRVAIA